jgi:type II restriction/modification system DNA methylase subunit YeeA
MNTKDLKAYAPKARRDFIAAVTKQAQKYGVTETVTHPVEINGDVCVVNGKPFPASMASRINKLGERVKSNGFEQTMEQVAYSWFNRLIAIRYMELHDYLGHGRRVLSHPEHPTGFQILEECTELSYGNSGEAGELPDLTHERVVELKLDGTKDEELYRELLLAQCHALHKAMPFLFETIDDETELLLPENLTKTDSLIHDLITDLAESDWGSIEVVGWLYQFYISEKKDEVIGKVVKSEDIPAATQLFTPNWIVKYMVQNSLGAQWLATYPESPLKAQMEYYIEPAEQTDEVNAKLKEITPESLNPEELTLIDPASGSGHILVEAYDLFKAIYLERGYRQRDIAQLILEKNLFGLDIDQRAAQLTGFALMMKGREDDRRLFERDVKLNVMALVNSTSLDVDTLVHGIDLSQYGLSEEDLTALKELFEHATTFGSLIQVPEQLAEKLPALIQLSETNSQDMFVKEVLEHLAPLVEQAEILAAQYYVVVANPPYIGTKYQAPILKKYLKKKFSGYEKDIYSACIIRNLKATKKFGRLGFMTPFTWMFLSSYETLRHTLIKSETISSLVQLEYSGFDGATVPICTFSLSRQNIPNFISSFIRLSDFKGASNQAPKTLEAIKNRGCGWLYESKPYDLMLVPTWPIAYWLSNAVRNCFQEHQPLLKIADTRKGMVTARNEDYVRAWFEIGANKFSSDSTSRQNALETKKKWFPYRKGGSYRKWYGNVVDVVNWENDGELLRSNKHPVEDRVWATNFNLDYIFTKSITWSDVTSAEFSARIGDNNSLFDAKGPSAFLSNEMHPILLGFLNSKIVSMLTKAINPSLSFQIGDLEKLPVAEVEEIDKITAIVDRLVSIHENDWNSKEKSWCFKRHPIVLEENTISESFEVWKKNTSEIVCESKLLEEENNRYFINRYGLSDELYPRISNSSVTLFSNISYRYKLGNESTDTVLDRFRSETIEELVSYAIGCMIGRYSLDEPGLIYANSGNEGFDASRYTKFPADDDGIIPLTDKEWFADDAANRLVEFISVAWNKAHLEENLNFLAANLSPKKGEDSRDTIRRYLCDKFYKDHMQTYKKRPIYWLFSSGKQKAFQCLVYLHRYNESTLARMRTEYVIPLTAKLSSHIEKLENDKGASGSAAEIKKLEKEIKNLHKQQTELTEFDEKLKHYADMRIPLDLDDGVKVNYGKFGDLLSDVKAIHGKAV